MSAVQPERLLALYASMLRIRSVESTLARLFADGEVPGFIHLSNGQEAVAAGVASAMSEGDTLATTHRGHGHVLARGLDLAGFFKEILGRAGGVCQGRGGSMHMADMQLGIIGGNGIVAAGIPIALGSALALKTRGTDRVAVTLFGDGAMAEGVLHESMNFAALLQLPLLLVCENNGWSEFSRTEQQFAAPLAKLADAFDIAYIKVDGNDVLEVADAAQAAIGTMRGGGGPRMLECRTHRSRGHYEGDAQKYRKGAEMAAGELHDALARTAQSLRAAGVPESELKAMKNAAEAAVSAALAQARADGHPDFDAAQADVYTHSRA